MRRSLVISIIFIVNFLNFCICNDDFFVECESDKNAHLFNGTETVTTFEIPISAFFLYNEGEQLINATGKSFQGEASEIVKDTTSAHEQEILDIVKQFKSKTRILSKFAHVGRRLYPRAESTLSKSSIPQKTFEGTKFAIKSSSTGIHVEKIVRGAKWAAKTSAQLGALYGATVIYDKLTGTIQSGWTDVERIHIKDDKIIVETKTKFYSVSGKYCEKHFIGIFENGYYSYNSTPQFIDEKEVQNCDENMFEEMFCFSKTFNSPPLNVSVNHCYRRRTKSKIIFVTNTDVSFFKKKESLS
uniref:Uncharacterized protein n=1 Tax=Panagrolaimus davidi TaxID=227884 RepID=A0A914QUD8_9BILA